MSDYRQEQEKQTSDWVITKTDEEHEDSDNSYSSEDDLNSSDSIPVTTSFTTVQRQNLLRSHSTPVTTYPTGSASNVNDKNIQSSEPPAWLNISDSKAQLSIATRSDETDGGEIYVGSSNSDHVRAIKRRETNRKAAQKCRQKQTEKESKLRQQFVEYESDNTRLKNEVYTLLKTRELLEKILSNHHCVVTKSTSKINQEPIIYKATSKSRAEPTSRKKSTSKVEQAAISESTSRAEPESSNKLPSVVGQKLISATTSTAGSESINISTSDVPTCKSEHHDINDMSNKRRIKQMQKLSADNYSKHQDEEDIKILLNSKSNLSGQSSKITKTEKDLNKYSEEASFSNKHFDESTVEHVKNFGEHMKTPRRNSKELKNLLSNINSPQYKVNNLSPKNKRDESYTDEIKLHSSKLNFKEREENDCNLTSPQATGLESQTSSVPSKKQSSVQKEKLNDPNQEISPRKIQIVDKTLDSYVGKLAGTTTTKDSSSLFVINVSSSKPLANSVSETKYNNPSSFIPKVATTLKDSSATMKPPLFFASINSRSTILKSTTSKNETRAPILITPQNPDGVERVTQVYQDLFFASERDTIQRDNRTELNVKLKNRVLSGLPPISTPITPEDIQKNFSSLGHIYSPVTVSSCESSLSEMLNNERLSKQLYSAHTPLLKQHLQQSEHTSTDIQTLKVRSPRSKSPADKANLQQEIESSSYPGTSSSDIQYSVVPLQVMDMSQSIVENNSQHTPKLAPPLPKTSLPHPPSHATPVPTVVSQTDETLDVSNNVPLQTDKGIGISQDLGNNSTTITKHKRKKKSRKGIIKQITKEEMQEILESGRGKIVSITKSEDGKGVLFAPPKRLKKSSKKRRKQFTNMNESNDTSHNQRCEDPITDKQAEVTSQSNPNVLSYPVNSFQFVAKKVPSPILSKIMQKSLTQLHLPTHMSATVLDDNRSAEVMKMREKVRKNDRAVMQYIQSAHSTTMATSSPTATSVTVVAKSATQGKGYVITSADRTNLAVSALLELQQSIPPQVAVISSPSMPSSVHPGQFAVPSNPPSHSTNLTSQSHKGYMNKTVHENNANDSKESSYKPVSGVNLAPACSQSVTGPAYISVNNVQHLQLPGKQFFGSSQESINHTIIKNAVDKINSPLSSDQASVGSSNSSNRNIDISQSITAYRDPSIVYLHDDNNKRHLIQANDRRMSSTLLVSGNSEKETEKSSLNQVSVSIGESDYNNIPVQYRQLLIQHHRKQATEQQQEVLNVPLKKRRKKAAEYVSQPPMYLLQTQLPEQSPPKTDYSLSQNTDTDTGLKIQYQTERSHFPSEDEKT